MIKQIQQYEITCDNCSATMILKDPTDYKRFGWELVPNPPMCKGTDSHYCCECIEYAEVKRNKLYKGRR